MLQPIVNNFQPFFVKADLEKNAFDASLTPNVVMNPIDHVDNFEDYASKV